MERMKEKILEEGRVLPGNILYVGSFLNQMIDTSFLAEVGAEAARLFRDEKPTKILTVEASGIGIGVAVGMTMGIPVVFAKKGRSHNVAGEVYSADVHSFTRKTDKEILVGREYLSRDDRILIVDDFLATGSALRGLISIVEAAGAELVGCCIAIEKGFQNAGDTLRKEGCRVESLAIIESMDENGIVFR